MTATSPSLMSLLPGWRERWVAALRAFGWAVPLPKGRTAHLETGPEGVVATVRSGGAPNRVRVRLTPLPRRTFEAGMRKLALRRRPRRASWPAAFRPTRTRLSPACEHGFFPGVPKRSSSRAAAANRPPAVISSPSTRPSRRGSRRILFFSRSFEAGAGRRSWRP